MERGDKINQNIWAFTVTEQVRITPEAIPFGASACASVSLRDDPAAVRWMGHLCALEETELHRAHIIGPD